MIEGLYGIFSQYKDDGEWIKPLYCPYCGGGLHRDKYTFAINKDSGCFLCHRGSCAVRGNADKLKEDLNIGIDISCNNFKKTEVKKEYTIPDIQLLSISEDIYNYFNERKISKHVVDNRYIRSDSDGNIAFRYKYKGETVLIKIRPIVKSKIKSWRIKGGMPVLYGMDLCYGSSNLVIVEGEMDALALDQCKIQNVVSVPSGATDKSWIPYCKEFICKFKNIVVWSDKDAAGNKMWYNISNEFDKCIRVNSRYKDANDMLISEGSKSVYNLVGRYLI